LVDSHYRPNADDFAGMYYASQGLPGLGYASRFYMEWEGPFMSMIVQGLWMRALFVGIPGGIIISCIKIMLWLSSIYMFNGLVQLISGKKDLAGSILMGASFGTLLYIISSAQDEIWHWVMGTVVYTHPVIALQIGIGLLCRKKFIWAILPFAYIMQSRATYAVLFYGLSFLIVLYAWLKNTNWKKQITVANIFLLLCFLVYLLAPGNANRMSPEGFDMAHYIHEYRREIQNILISFNLAKLDRVFIALLVIIPVLPSSGFVRESKLNMWYLLPGFAYLLFVLAHGILFVYATGYAAWNRVFAMHTFLFVIVCGFYAYTAYTKWAPDSTKNKIMKLGVPLALAFLMFKMYQPLSHQLQLGKSFAEAYDVRSEEIFNFEGTATDTLFIDALPDAGILHYWEFSEDASFWVNDDFRMRYDVEFQVALKPQE
jgi:hypothetical protein